MIAALTTFAVLVLLAVAFRWLIRHSRARLTLDPTCAACGYIVSGLPTTTCPECGADLSRPRAVRMPGALPTLSRLSTIVMWTAILWLGYATVNEVWLRKVDPVQIVHVRLHFIDPKSKAFQQINVFSDYELYHLQLLRGRATIACVGQGGRRMPPRLVWDLRTNTCYTDLLPPRRREFTFDDEGILAWLAECGVDTVTNANVRSEAASIAQVSPVGAMGVAMAANDFVSSGASFSYEQRPPRVVHAVRASFAIAWLLVLTWLWWLRSRSSRFASAEGAQAAGPRSNATTV